MMPKQLNYKIKVLPWPRCELAESPVWDDKRDCLYWVDIRAGKLFEGAFKEGEAAAQVRKWQLNAPLAAVALDQNLGQKSDHASDLLLAFRDEVCRFDPDSFGLELMAKVPIKDGKSRLNDAKVSPEGRFLLGALKAPETSELAQLYSLSAKSEVLVLQIGLYTSNGLAWSPCGQYLYHSDSGLKTDVGIGRVWRYRYCRERGELSDRTVFVDYLPEWGRPDGAAMDVEGHYWSAGVSAGRINRFNPNGELVGYVKVPMQNPTMPCFGGPDLKTLFVTSLQRTDGSSESDTLAGKLITIDMEVAGVPVGRFGKES
ncbi:MAG: SMP-30/gluconolactonase/LRE family protein [Pontibacterium sp.]